MNSIIRRPLALLAILGTTLPALLVLSALRTYAVLEDQKAVYLRSRAAAIAARLETLPLDAIRPEDFFDSEPGLTGLEILDRSSSPAFLDGMWEGKELFRTERLPGARFLAWAPFHSQPGSSQRIARIELDAQSANFLVEHATHHIWITAAGAIVIVALSILTGRSIRTAERETRRRAEVEHLARLGEMSAVLAHEIRNPLGTIKGFAQLIAEKDRPDEANLARPIVAESERLERLVKDLLAYGRPAQPVYRPVETAGIAAIMQQHASSWPGDFQCSFDRATLDSDPSFLEQALLNLLNNAFDAAGSRPDSQVRLTIRAGPDEATFEVADNGPGLSGEALQRLFEPFHTTKANGVGLGLSITRRLVESLGGELTLENAEGGGVRARIRLPRKRER